MTSALQAEVEALREEVALRRRLAELESRKRGRTPVAPPTLRVVPSAEVRSSLPAITWRRLDELPALPTWQELARAKVAKGWSVRRLYPWLKKQGYAVTRAQITAAVCDLRPTRFGPRLTPKQKTERDALFRLAAESAPSWRVAAAELRRAGYGIKNTHALALWHAMRSEVTP